MEKDDVKAVAEVWTKGYLENTNEYRLADAFLAGAAWGRATWAIRAANTGNKSRQDNPAEQAVEQARRKGEG